MKIQGILGVGLLLLAVAESIAGGVRVKGYTRKDGTYVAPHYRSSPNLSRYDNYSSSGNYNPYTGRIGTVQPQAAPSYKPPSYYPYIPPPSSAASLATASQHQLLPGYSNALLKANSAGLANSAVITPEQISSDTAVSVGSTQVDQALKSVEALGRHYRDTDPNWQAKLLILQPRIAEIQSTLPPNQWANAVAIAWAALPSPSFRTSHADALNSYARQECQEAADKASDLADAANNLARCASQGDLTDDCSRQTRATRYAADDYESAIGSISEACS